MTAAESAQFVHTVALALHLHARGIQCSLWLPLAEAPLVRVDGLSRIETIARADGSFEVWSIDDPVAPLRCDQSLDEALHFLCAHEGRA